MRTVSAILIFLGLFAQSACKQKQADTWVITQRIQYDVTIKSPDADLEWWIQNIEGMNREALITDLLEAAYSGKIKAYDPFLLNLISPDQVRSIGRRSETLRLQRASAPYDYYDTIISKELSIHDITRIRFLEEWKLNKKDMQIKKDVIGVALLLESYDENGNLRGFQPMFWFFFEDNYPGPLQRKTL